MTNRSDSGVELKVNVGEKTLELEGGSVTLDDTFVSADVEPVNGGCSALVLKYGPRLPDLMDEGERVCELLRWKGRERDRDEKARPGKYMVSPSYDETGVPYLSLVGDFRPVVV